MLPVLSKHGMGDADDRAITGANGDGGMHGHCSASGQKRIMARQRILKTPAVYWSVLGIYCILDVPISFPKYTSTLLGYFSYKIVEAISLEPL